MSKAAEKLLYVIVNKTDSLIQVPCFTLAGQADNSTDILKPGEPFYIEGNKFIEYRRGELIRDDTLRFYVVKFGDPDDQHSSELCGHLMTFACNAWGAFDVPYIACAIVYAYLPLSYHEEPIISCRVNVCDADGESKWGDMLFDAALSAFDFSRIPADNTRDLNRIVNTCLAKSMNELAGA